LLLRGQMCEFELTVDDGSRGVDEKKSTEKNTFALLISSDVCGNHPSFTSIRTLRFLGSIPRSWLGIAAIA
jgi:hypothetical protein